MYKEIPSSWFNIFCPRSFIPFVVDCVPLGTNGWFSGSRRVRRVQARRGIPILTMSLLEESPPSLGNDRSFDRRISSGSSPIWATDGVAAVLKKRNPSSAMRSVSSSFSFLVNR